LHKQLLCRLKLALQTVTEVLLEISYSTSSLLSVLGSKASIISIEKPIALMLLGQSVSLCVRVGLQKIAEISHLTTVTDEIAMLGVNLQNINMNPP